MRPDLVTESSLRLAYWLCNSVGFALESPFGLAFPAALPPSAALCRVTAKLTYTFSTVCVIIARRKAAVKRKFFNFLLHGLSKLKPGF